MSSDKRIAVLILAVSLGLCCADGAVQAAFVGPSGLHNGRTTGRNTLPCITRHRPKNCNPITALHVKSLRDILDDGPPPQNLEMGNGPEWQRQRLTKQLLNLSTREIQRELEHAHGVQTVALRGKAQLVAALAEARLGGTAVGASPVNFAGSMGNAGVNMNHGPDVKTMGAGEIKRELQLYGVGTDQFLEKRDLEEALVRERRMRMPASSQRGGGAGGAPGVTVVPGVGNVKSAGTSAPAPEVPLSPEHTYIYDDSQSPGEQAKLRELQIAYEFERVQSSLGPDDVRVELEATFGISARYFLGTQEMAYALAVARVDEAIERQKNGIAVGDDGCLVGEDGRPLPRNKNDNSASSECLTEEDLLPTPEDLVSMEYANLEQWDEATLADELENQYGILAKHFLGKKEMAYALAVERVTQAVKEGGLIVDDYEEEVEDYSVMTDDDMMRLMEEEMRREEEERAARRTTQREPSSFGETVPRNGSVRDSPKKGTFQTTAWGANAFAKKGKKASLRRKSKSLADMIRGDDKRGRNRPQKRTPLSSEPPLGRQRHQRPSDPLERGTVIGGAASPQSLKDVLKGAERPKASSRSRATAPPPPRPTKKAFKTTHHDNARFDDSFNPSGPARPNAGGSGSGNRGYSTSWNKGPAHSAAAGGRTKARQPPQQPFEPAPFTAPGTHNAANGASSRKRPPKRVPPQTPFSSPVMDGARGPRRATTQGPFQPFTPPGKRSTNGAPPPRKRPSDPRGFNIRDTPNPAQPFVGSGYVDGSTPYAPPLQVEPPPRDPAYDPKERPFEPAAFRAPGQGHAVRTDPAAHRGDRWNYGNPSSRQPERQRPPPKKPPETKRHKTGASPFGNLKDMFGRAGGKKDGEAPEEEPAGFKSGNVEVFSADQGSGRELGNKWKDAMEVEIIDAETVEESDDWDDGVEEADANYQPSSAERFSNAWRGGPQSESSAYFAHANGSDQFAGSANGNVDAAANRAIERAQELLSSSAELRAAVARAQSDPRVRDAVQECMGNPVSFGRYLDDPSIGPILTELKECIGAS
ncbi:hypothetical protein ACHAXT_011968 [Thalassiosira profunda]